MKTREHKLGRGVGALAIIFLIMTVDGIMTVKPVWQSMILTRQENR